MSNVDISQLGDLAPVKPLDLSVYPDAKGGREIPKAGRYTVRAPESFPSTAFGRTKSGGNLSARVDPTILGPTNEGFQVRFTNLSAKVYQRDGKDVSQMGDYLRAFGITEELTGDPQQIADLIAGTANQTYEILGNWEARHLATGFQVKGMANFPPDGNGGFQPWIQHPTEKNAETGEPLRLRANFVVTKYLAKK